MRHKLTKEQKKLCRGCRHGGAAHVGGKRCHMKYCKCERMR